MLCVVLIRRKALPVYQTEKQAYSNTQLPKRGFNTHESTPQGGLALHIRNRFIKRLSPLFFSFFFHTIDQQLVYDI